jgi:hypothetical protein
LCSKQRGCHITDAAAATKYPHHKGFDLVGCATILVVRLKLLLVSRTFEILTFCLPLSL